MTSAKVAIITGGSSGIGRASAIKLSEAGWSLALFARRISELKETQARCADPSKCLLVQGDVTDEGAVVKLFRDTLDQFGRVDMVFNNAGTLVFGPIEEMALADFQRVVNVNLIGSWLCTREAFKVFKAQTPPGGRIINNGSLAAHVPRPNSSPYASSKHAITGLTKSTALDGRAYDITCTQIDIGNANTGIGGPSPGLLQPNGQIVPEVTFDVKYVADAIVHIAGLPNDVTVLTYTIMASKVPFVGRG